MSIESDVFEGKPIPRHTYEITEGSKPMANAAHEPRTLAHTETVDGRGGVISMMTEIGDGTFVAWTHCVACNNAVATCTCPGGPAEPKYMKPWRDKRFERSLNERPDPEYPMLPSVISWLRERGYTVTKKGEKAPAPEAVEAAAETTVFEQVTGEKPHEDTAVTTGIDAAIEAVQAPVAPQNLEGFDVDF